MDTYNEANESSWVADTYNELEAYREGGLHNVKNASDYTARRGKNK